jgi:HSP20 family protein
MAKTEITRPDDRSLSRPLDLFSTMRNEMNRMLERFEHDWPRLPGLFGRAGATLGMVPDLDVREDGKQLTIEADLPGLAEKDVTLTLRDGVLTIKGERKQEREEKAESYHMMERSFGSFERSLRLPDTIDENSVEARFDKGVLKITAGKRPDAVKTERTIAIKKA